MLTSVLTGMSRMQNPRSKFRGIACLSSMQARGSRVMFYITAGVQAHLCKAG